MKSDERTFSDYVALLKRRWQIAAGVGGLIFLGSVVTVFTIPAVYEATAVIQIERPQIPEGVVSRLPAVDDVSIPVQTQLIVELCSR